MPETTFHVLLTLREGALQAPAILDRLRTLPGSHATPSLAAFYRCLKSALDEGWLEIVGSDASGPGRPRQIYSLTPFGSRAVEKEARRLQSLAALALGEPAVDR